MNSPAFIISKNTSARVGYSSFIASVMILFIHASLPAASLSKEALFVQSFIGDGLCRIAVPYFFIRSGFFFFLNINSIEPIFSRLKKRIKSLFIPYLFWIFAGLAFLFVVGRFSLFQQFIIRQSPWASFDAFLGAVLYNPINYQLWFLRDLLMLCIISPILYVFIRYCSWACVIVCAVFYVWFPTNVYCFYISFSLFYFVLGGTIAMKKPGLIDMNPGKYLWVIAAVYLGLLLYVTYTKVSYALFLPFLNAILPLMGVYCLWNFVRFLPEKHIYSVASLVSFSFFIYLAHEPLLTFIKKICLVFVPHTSVSFVLLYLFLPLITFTIVMWVGHRIKTFSPSFFSFIVGGR